MANYGYQVLGGSLENAINGQLFYSLLPAIGESGSATHVQFGGRNFNDATREIIVFIADSSGNVLGQSAVTLDAGSTSFAFYQIPLISPVALVSGQQYHVGVQTEGVGGTQILFDTAQSGFTYFTEAATWPTIPATITPVSGVASKALSLYIEYTPAAGPTLTGPDTTTEGAETTATGTLHDTITTFSLISGSYSIEQTVDSSTTTTTVYDAESGVNLCSPGAPVSGVPLEATVTAAGITPYQVQQEADDGTNPPATRNITLNGEATHEVIQTMIAVANTTPGESIYGTDIIVVEDDMQAYAPKVANGMNITWAADGTFTTDADQTETITVGYFSAAIGQWSCISLTIKDTSIISAGISQSISQAIVKPISRSI